jgi:hypothetical protein
VLIDSHPARPPANAAEMHGFAKHVALCDPLETGHHPEALDRRAFNGRQKSGVVLSGRAYTVDHDDGYNTTRLRASVRESRNPLETQTPEIRPVLPCRVYLQNG